MPNRHAHWVILLLLVPVVVVAFWRDYFGVLGTAPFAFHAHGATATLWIMLVALQSWTAHHRKFALHRLTGTSVLFLVPLFAGASALVVHSMSLKFASGHPFYGVMGARLGLADVLITVVLVAMVRQALRNRRRVGLHAGYMIGTLLLVIPPILARLPIPVPIEGAFGEALSIVIALALYFANRRDGAPYLVVAAAMLCQIAAIGWLGGTALWSGWFTAIGAMSAPLLAVAAMMLATLALWTVCTPWSLRRQPRRATMPA